LILLKSQGGRKKMTNKPMMKCGHAANAVTADNKPTCAICNCTELGIFDDYKDMTLIHSKDYVLKIARELNYTIEDVRSQVSRWFISRDLDGNLSTEEAIFFLRLFYADDIRYILTFNKEKEK
jgi:hypothetical protein